MHLMKPISRRQFLQMAGVSVAAAAVMGLPEIGGGKPKFTSGTVLVRPTSATPPAELAAFCASASFRSAADAMRAMAACGRAVEIYEI